MQKSYFRTNIVLCKNYISLRKNNSTIKEL